MSLPAKFAAMTLKAKIAVICAAAAVVGTAAVIVGVAVTKEDAYRVLKVFEMAGTSVITRESSGELDAYVGMNLENGDLLTVGEESTLRLSLDNDKYILLDEGTVMKLNAQGDSADSKTTIELRKGTILNEITKPLSPDSTYEIATPKATMAVRGTSFSVTVTEDGEGGYIIDINAFQGKVEVILLDKNGEPTDMKAVVTADKALTIHTEANAETGNPAEVDGVSRFVCRDEDGNIIELAAEGDPLYDILYELISENVRSNAIRSNDSSLMILDEKILQKLRGSKSDSGEKSASETSAVSTAAESQESEVTTVSEAEVTTASEPAETTVPVTEETEPISTETASVTASETVSDTAPSEDNVQQTVMTEAPAETTVPTVSETTSAEAGTTTAVSEKEEVSETTASETKPFVTLPNSENTFMTLPSVTTYTERETSQTTAPSFTIPNNNFTSQTSPTTYNTSVFEPIIVTSGTTASETIPEDTTVSSEETTTTAESETIIYSVSFVCEGEVIATREAEENGVVSDIPTIPDKTGYTTAKWVYGAYEAEFTSSTVITGNMTVTAEYIADKYKVTFSADGADSVPEPIYVDYGKSVETVPPVPAKTGHTPVKWVYGADNAEFTSSTIITGNMTVTAEYTANKYTVTFVAEGVDSVPAPILVEYGKTVTELPEIPAKTDYKAIEWVYGDDDATFDTSVIIKGDLEVRASYKKLYTVSFVTSFDGSELDSQQVAEGELPEQFEITNTAVDTDGDGVFDWLLWKWDEQFAAISPITAEITITVEYRAYNNIGEYRIRDMLAADQVVMQGLYDKDDPETISLPASGSLADGYTFVGWGDVSSGAFNTGLIPGATEPYPYDGSIYDLSNPTPGGSTVTVRSDYSSFASDVEYRAVYKKACTVTWKDTDGNIITGAELTKYVNTDTLKSTSFDVLLSEAPSLSPSSAEKTIKWYYIEEGSEYELESSATFSDSITIYAKEVASTP
ncbi:MAG: InlB B-repeat-containing protein [Oscillospiraceae bacterium]|nr:InlB B-repeat-containing protein [Oscillospiraceae bacterium]